MYVCVQVLVVGWWIVGGFVYLCVWCVCVCDMNWLCSGLCIFWFEEFVFLVRHCWLCLLQIKVAVFIVDLRVGKK